MRFSRAFIAFGVALSSVACSLLVDLDGLNDGGLTGDSGFDASNIAEASASDAIVQPSDGSAIFDGETPFDCDRIDATFCDDFNRDAALGSNVWQRTNTSSNCALSVDGTLVTSVGATSTPISCFLYSNNAPKNRHLSLEFDVLLSTEITSPAVVIAAVDNNLDAPNAQGVLAGYFQMLTLGDGNTKVGFIEYIPDAAASPQPGNSYPFWNLTDLNDSFIVPGVPCHVVLELDAIASTATATASCEGHAPNVLASADGGAPVGFLANPQIELGYDNTGVTSPAWNVTYDNMVFRSTP